MSTRTPLARVEGLGAAHRGTEHFARQRATSIALVPLAVWFAFGAFSLVGGDRAAAVAFLAQPVNAVLMALFIIAGLIHMVVGLQVVIEDYVHGEGVKIALLLLDKFFGWAVGAAAIYALLKIVILRD